MNIIKLLGVFGLALDITGSWYLAKGIVRKTLEQIKKEAPQALFAINDAYVIGALQQKVEACFGFWFLLSGFLLQTLTYIFYEYTVNINWVWIIGSFLILYIGIVVIANKLCENIKKKREKQYFADKND